MALFDKVEDVIDEAKGIAFDTCHKIYVLLDDAQVAQMREYEYDPLITSDEMTPSQMLETIKGWYEDSCFLRFVEAVRTVAEGEDPNLGFTTLIAQGESEECEDCGETGCAGVCNDNCDNCGYQGNCGCDDEEEEE